MIHCLLMTQKGGVLEKPSHAVIWVAKTYPHWQTLVLMTLKTLYEVRQSVVVIEH